MKKQAKKQGFTLAETLLTLAIIGICAAMLITTIKNMNPTERSNLIMARKAVGNFTEATKQVLLFNSSTKKMDNLSCGESKDNDTDATKQANAKCVLELYAKYLQVTKIKSADSTGLGGQYFGELIDGLSFGIEYDSRCNLHEGETMQVLPPSEGVLSDVIVSGACAMIYYDVNGNEKPNIVGKDRFVIPVRKSGVKIQAKTVTTGS